MYKVLIIALAFVITASSAFAEIATVKVSVYDKASMKPLTGVIVGFKVDDKVDYKITDRYGRMTIDLEEGSYSVFTKYFVNQDTLIDYSVGAGNNELILEIIPDISSIYRPKRTYMSKSIDRKAGAIERYTDDALAPEYAEMSVTSEAMTASGGSGAEVRGGRSKAKTIKTDGVEVSNPFTGSMGIEGEVSDPTPSTFAIEDVEVHNAGSGSAGVLTSGEVNDFRKWDYWQDISVTDLSEYRKTWNFTPVQRYSVQLVNSNNLPVIDANVQLISGNNIVLWESKSDNTGKAELWSNIYNKFEQTPNDLMIKAISDEQVFAITDIKEFHDGINFIQMNVACSIPNTLDIVWAVDATGSMGDEIDYLKAELSDIIGKIQDQHKDININLGSVFYRDIRDDYIVQKSDLTNDIDKTLTFIESQRASGGGDFPEGVEFALQSVVNEFNWSEKAVARLMFLILDAPPHKDKDVLARLNELTAKASMMGIRIIPVTCSGIDKSTEYLMRSMALATNGTYVFLTDHSGVGGSHIEPTTEKYDVELLNDLFIRLIDQFTVTTSCDETITMETEVDENIYNHGEANPGFEDIKFLMNCYPNPTDGLLNVKMEGTIDELYLVDMNGKILQRLDRIESGTIQLDLTSYPTGFYFIKYRVGTNWAGYKILLSR